jgi:GxxExxY protein
MSELRFIRLKDGRMGLIGFEFYNLFILKIIVTIRMQYEELTRKIIGCAMKVHSTLGCGFQEVIYQRAMAIEMEKQGLRLARELEMFVFYEGVNIGTRRVDFFVEDRIMTELKAVSHLKLSFIL